ncbi:MAG TPA: hypothetical protein VN772_01390 [Solirubrobacteraceae bacterium]|nr:hypothetical protein [Solirubrobacteraceae bacterium]
MSRRTVAIDVLCALLIIPIWTYYGAVAALASALALGLALRLVAHLSGARRRPPF